MENTAFVLIEEKDIVEMSGESSRAEVLINWLTEGRRSMSERIVVVPDTESRIKNLLQAL